MPATLDFARGLDDAADDAVGFSFLCAEPVVALRVGDDLLERLTGLGRDLAVQTLAHLEDLFGLDRDVARLSAHTAERLMQQEARERQAEAVLLARAEIDMCT